MVGQCAEWRLCQRCKNAGRAVRQPRSTGGSARSPKLQARWAARRCVPGAALRHGARPRVPLTDMHGYVAQRGAAQRSAAHSVLPAPAAAAMGGGCRKPISIWLLATMISIAFSNALVTAAACAGDWWRRLTVRCASAPSCAWAACGGQAETMQSAYCHIA